MIVVIGVCVDDVGNGDGICCIECDVCVIVVDVGWVGSIVD